MTKKSERMFNKLIEAGIQGYMIPIMELSAVSKHARQQLEDGTPPALIPAAVAAYCAERYQKA